jgi:hypothetical protein
MQWRHRHREAYVPRPKVEKVSADELARLREMASRFVSKSPVLSELVAKVSIQRSRFYVFDTHGYVMARITPLAEATFLLEAPRGDAWTAAKKGSWPTVLNALNRDKRGTFHGQGTLVGKGKADAGSVQVQLRKLGVPIPVLAQPRHWYAMRRTPSIIEVDARGERALVGFESFGMFGSFGGTCLYARVEGKWGCYVVRPSEAGSIESAVAWLTKQGWKGWR